MCVEHCISLLADETYHPALKGSNTCLLSEEIQKCSLGFPSGLICFRFVLVNLKCWFFYGTKSVPSSPLSAPQNTAVGQGLSFARALVSALLERGRGKGHAPATVWHEPATLVLYHTAFCSHNKQAIKGTFLPSLYYCVLYLCKGNPLLHSEDTFTALMYCSASAKGL